MLIDSAYAISRIAVSTYSVAFETIYRDMLN